MNCTPASDSSLRRKCQLFTLQAIAEPLGKVESAIQFKNRLKRYVKRRFRFLHNMLREAMYTGQDVKKLPMARTMTLQPGDKVQVLSREEIQATLNLWNGLKGCAFMEEMWQYCGTRQKVLKRVNKFLDERDYKIKKCKGIVILDRVMCNGTKDFGECDRSCFFFWREEWLKKIED